MSLAILKQLGMYLINGKKSDIEMLLILTLLLFVTLIVLYYANKKDFTNPAVLITSVYFVASLVAFLSSNGLSSDIHLHTLLVIVIAILIFVFGTFIGTRFKQKNQLTNVSDFIINEVKINKKTIYLLSVIFIITTVLNFIFVYELSVRAGNIYGIEKMLNFAYKAKYDPNIDSEPNFVLTQMLVFMQVFAYFSIFTILYNFKLLKNKSNLMIYIFPIFIYIVNILLETGRTSFIRLFIFSFIVYGILGIISNKKFNNYKRSFKKKYIIIGVALFLLIYQSYGNLRGSLYTDWNYLIQYVGNPIYALDIFLQQSFDRPFFGSETLYSIYSTLRTIGFDMPYKDISLPRVFWSTGDTNIYTALRRYINDYSFAGMMIIQFSLGLFYGYIHKRAIVRLKISSIILYSMFIFPVVESILEERFFITVLSVRTIYVLFYVFILLKFIFEKNEIIERRLA